MYKIRILFRVLATQHKLKQKENQRQIKSDEMIHLRKLPVKMSRYCSLRERIPDRREELNSISSN